MIDFLHRMHPTRSIYILFLLSGKQPAMFSCMSETPRLATLDRKLPEPFGHRGQVRLMLDNACTQRICITSSSYEKLAANPGGIAGNGRPAVVANHDLHPSQLLTSAGLATFLDARGTGARDFPDTEYCVHPVGFGDQ